MPRLVSYRDVATRWGISESTVRRAVAEGRLHALRLTVGGRPRIWTGELTELVLTQLEASEGRGIRKAR